MDYWIYLSLFISCFLSATILPIPSEIGLVAVITSGYDPVISVILATIGNSLGGLTNYFLGRFSKSLWVKKKGADKKQFSKLMPYITKYGSLCALLSWIPVIGDPLLLMLGFMRIRFLPIVIYMVAGKLTRYIVLALFF
ncbi:MAG: DedA family protein [Bacteroidetes bacterium]|nr:DedA family protein [Bacteroidota bacterium]